MSLAEGARRAVNVCMDVKGDEQVLILTDTVTEKIGVALFDAVVEAKAKPYFVKMLPGTRHGAEPPELVAEMMRVVDVVFAPTKYSLTHTNARRRATKNGVRIATMPGITTRMMSTGGMTADFKEIERRIKRVHRAIRLGKTAELTTSLGTDLKLSFEGRKWITEDTGICHKNGAFTNLPAGELFIAPKENTANGKLIVDGAFGAKVEQPVKISVKDGRATKINDQTIQKMLDKAGKCGRNLAELGIGMNPKSRIIGNVLADEKVLGTVHIAFGDNSTFGGRTKCDIHLDGVLKSPTLVIGDVKVLEEGKLVI